MEDAVEILRPSESFSNLREAALNRSRGHAVKPLSSHPYSSMGIQQDTGSSSSFASESTRDGRTARLPEEIEEINSPSSHPRSVTPAREVAVPLPAPPPSAFLLYQEPLASISPTPHHPLGPLPPIPDDSPAPSPTTSFGTLQFDPNRDLASAWTLYPRTSQHVEEEQAEFSTRFDTVSVTSESQASHHVAKVTPEPLEDEDNARRASVSFDEDAKAREWEKRRGRKKLKWWGLFWLVVIGGIAIGIGVGAATQKKSKGGEAVADRNELESAGAQDAPSASSPDSTREESGLSSRGIEGETSLGVSVSSSSSFASSITTVSDISVPAQPNSSTSARSIERKTRTRNPKNTATSHSTSGPGQIGSVEILGSIASQVVDVSTKVAE